MGQVRRWHTGTIAIPAHVLTAIEDFLGMHSAASRAQVVAARTDITNRIEAGDLHLEDTCGKFHDYLNHREVDEVQALRGWNRLRLGNITVDAHLLCAARNLLDDETYRRGDCEDYLEELRNDTDGPDWLGRDDLLVELEFVRKRVEDGQGCDRCEFCRACILRDVIDDLFDVAGFAPGSRWAQGPGDAMVTWTQVTNAAPSALAAA